MKKNYSEITPLIKKLADLSIKNDTIDSELYDRHSVNRGLRDVNGNGVLTGLTEISEIQSKKIVNGEKVPCDGILRYRGYDINDLVGGFTKDGRNGFEEIVYLLLFSELPDKAQLEEFNSLLASYRTMPSNFVRDIILKAPSHDMMNSLARCVLTMYAYDKNPDDISIPNVLRQCLQLIALFPIWSVYSYQSYMYSKMGESLFIHHPKEEYSTAQNILHLLRADGEFTELEAEILDIALVLHAEHGGGNNSTFTTHVVTSSGTDTYSSVAASLGSLKGPKHGGANNKVVKMFENIKENIPRERWNDTDAVTAYLEKILSKEAFDKTGLIYGMGHAVYSISDPRAEIFKKYVENLSVAKNREDEYRLYSNVAEGATRLISEKRKIYKGVSANVDFYSGFVYSMLDLPQELFTPLFAISRIAGWSAHRIEELINAGKIIRPAYLNVGEAKEYISLTERK